MINSAGVVIVGFGHAGKIHKRAYDQLGDDFKIAAVVEPNNDRFKEIGAVLPDVRAYRDLDAALDELGGEVVIDFCVPAKVNLELVETAIRHGVSKFLIEKPLGWDVASTRQLVDLLGHCDVVYLDTYVASKGVQQLLERITDQDSAPVRVDVIFHKNRVQDSRLSRGFVHDAVPSAWMIEGPHMLSISRQIAGEIAEISSARTFDMEIGSGLVLPDHGGGHALLEHENGAHSHLELNMCSERNERRVEVQLQNNVRVAVDLPPSKSREQFSEVEVLQPSGEREVFRFEDRPMENCVRNAILHLLGQESRVSKLSDGLVVCAIVARMTERTQFWQSVPKQWKYFGPPLRPCPEDISVMEEQVAQWVDSASADECNVLLCGVTPEIVNMKWPAGTRLWAVEISRAMIEEVWPDSGPETRQAFQAEWTRLPFRPESFDIVIGDGCLTSLIHPQQQMLFLESIKGVLRSNGLMIMRFFVQKSVPEPPAAVFSDLKDGRVGSFHAFKWRLAMALQETSGEGVRVDKIWRSWDEAGLPTPWTAQDVDTIKTYRGSDHRLTFTNLSEIRDLFSPLFLERFCSVPEYELGERCPILVHSPR